MSDVIVVRMEPLLKWINAGPSDPDRLARAVRLLIAACGNERVAAELQAIVYLEAPS